MKIALLGYGKMGKEIEQMALSRNHTIHCVIDNKDDWETKMDTLQQCDVAIDFSTPSTVLHNIEECFRLNIPIVVGTTGWHEKMIEVKKKCLSQNKSFFWASNFSIGVNIFFQVNKLLAKLMNAHPEYHVNMKEIHHIAKVDAPSGTAITLANDIITALDWKRNWTLFPAISEEALTIESVREGNVPGTHEVAYTSENDSLTIRHEAKSRKGFASGAVLAAEFLAGKKGFFSMEDLIS